MGLRIGGAPDEPTPARPGKFTAENPPPDRVSKPKEGTKTFTEDPAGLSPAEAKSWLEIQIPYENHATNPDLAVQAYSFCKDLVHKFQSRMHPVYDQWAVNQSFIRGTYYNRSPWDVDDIHSPAMYVALETLVPRIEEAIYPNREWFQCLGREKMDKKDQDKLRDLLLYQMEAIDHIGDANGGIRDMLTYQIVCAKIYWDTHIDNTRVKREWSKETIEGKTKWKSKVSRDEKIVFNGPRCNLIDPFDMLFDTDRTKIEEMQYIGNWCRLPYSYIERMGNLGLYANHTELWDQAPLSRWDYSTYEKEERKPDYGHYVTGQKYNQDGDKEFEVLELWGKYDIHRNGAPVECVITIANNNVILQVRENYHDDKHRPYAIGRAARDAHDLLNVGPLDHCARLNAAQDFHRQLFSRAHENTITPTVLIDEQNDIPREVTALHAGKFITVNDINGVKELKLSSTLNDWAGTEAILNTNIEEVSGATKAVKGSGASDTATENINDLKEASRRLRAYVNSYTQFENDILRQFHSLNRQFCTGPIKYRVLGKRAAGMDIYDVLEPELLNYDVDFDFAATGSIHSGELRHTQLLQFLNVAHPYVVAQMGQINIPYLLKELAREALPSLDVDKVIKVPTPLDELLTQSQENMLLAQGQKLEVDPQDDDETHLEELSELKLRAVYGQLDDHVAMAVLEHWNKHVIQLERKRQQQAASQNQPPTYQPGQQDALTAQRGTTGNQQPYGRLGSGSPAQTPFGETPGPGNGAQTPSADRQMGAPQTQNQPGY